MIRITTSNKTIEFTTKDGFLSPEMTFEQFLKMDIPMENISTFTEKFHMTKTDLEKFKKDMGY